MVSFWPWKADDTASFEKTLSSLSGKISKASLQRDRLRSRSRRFKVLWTLYTSFAYILYSIILAMVTGRQNWGPVEYAAVIGGPFVIYLVRTAIAAYYDYRLSSNQAYLDDLQQQRDAAIEKFKEATKYNSTQQLLEKYGAAPKGSSSSQSTPSSASKRKSGGVTKQEQQQQQSRRASQSSRTSLPPPPTANIHRPDAASSSSSSSPPPPPPAQQVPNTPPPIQQIAPSPPRPLPSYPVEPSASFAPNAYPQYYVSPSGGETGGGSNWYDRILDVILGEDETRAINRLALICSNCRLVNGQAPPGLKRLEDLGTWKCSGCGALNGVEMGEVEKLVQEKDREFPKDSEQIVQTPVTENIKSEEIEGPIVNTDTDESSTPARSTRSQTQVENG